VSFFSRARRCCWEIAVFDHTHSTHAMSAATRFVQPPDASGEAKGRRTDAQPQQHHRYRWEAIWGQSRLKLIRSSGSFAARREGKMANA